MSDNPYLARALEIARAWYLIPPGGDAEREQLAELIAAAMAEAAKEEEQSMDGCIDYRIAELQRENAALRQRIEAAEDCVQNYGMDRDGLLRILRGEEPS